MSKDFDHENPENWKWGTFYVNKNDARLVVPKRNPILGWTFNFAHPISYLILIIILLIIILASYYS